MMKKKLLHLFIMGIAIISLIIVSCKKNDDSGQTQLIPNPANPNNRVAYYAFDATPQGGQGKLPITTFTDKANEVVMFEGTLWEVADSIHYGGTSSYILTLNGGLYKHYKQIINDIKTLQARGVKVLWNVDDDDKWLESSPFTTYNGKALNPARFASFIDSCVTLLGLDGISLDIEHLHSPVNINWTTVIKSIGKYFGPKSSRPSNTLYIAAIYSGGIGNNEIGKSTDMASYFNFVMDMGYFQNNDTRFHQYADVIGNGKVMDGMSYDYNSQSDAVAWAAWEPSPVKAGVMVFAGNVNKAYTDAIFNALK
jgi:hypothetical protein